MAIRNRLADAKVEEHNKDYVRVYKKNSKGRFSAFDFVIMKKSDYKKGLVREEEFEKEIREMKKDCIDILLSEMIE